MTVLLVDDDQRLRAVLRMVLEQLGYVVLEAPCGREALSIAGAYGDPIDVLLTDIEMPGMSGCELANRLTRARPRTRVLFMSGVPLEQLRRRRLLPDGAPFLDKPFGVDMLESAVRAACSE